VTPTEALWLGLHQGGDRENQQVSPRFFPGKPEAKRFTEVSRTEGHTQTMETKHKNETKERTRYKKLKTQWVPEGVTQQKTL